ncbi:MAG: hypothetical protein HYS86_01115 [Candidatus Chisholmbacteria bacterium]|nr:hypothetical protein [Candidatus Chisholmbacteria bacterium]
MSTLRIGGADVIRYAHNTAMGSFVELNDTLQVTTEQGFPKELILSRHQQKPFKAADFKGKVFNFQSKPNARIYHAPPIRCFLVHNLDDKWLYWGHCLILEQTIHASLDGKTKTTSGKFVITKIYSPEQQKMMTLNESPAGLSYF